MKLQLFFNFSLFLFSKQHTNYNTLFIIETTASERMAHHQAMIRCLAEYAAYQSNADTIIARSSELMKGPLETPL